jgi:iron complex transport system ATP-binding protein
MMLAPNPAGTLEAQGLALSYGPRAVLADVSLSLRVGGVTALVGPNGCGKSTLLKALARLKTPDRGAVMLDGAAIARLPTREVARRLSLLPQAPSAPGAITVRELVEQGRFPHVGALGMLRRQDHAAIDEALALTDMARFAHRAVDELSGGERQRAWIALALAQDTPWLLLDEPTTFLDIGHQLEVLELVARLNAERSVTIVMVLHDLNQAARFAERMVVLHEGRIAADGTPADVLTADLLREVFHIEALILRDEAATPPQIVPLRYLRPQTGGEAAR